MSVLPLSASDISAQARAAFSEIYLGQEIPAVEVVTRPADLVRFAGAVDDYAPPHWDHLYMVEHGFPGVIVHGWLSFSIMCRVAATVAPPLLAHFRAFSVHYSRPNLPGPALYGGAVKAIREDGEVDIDIWADNATGRRLAEGSVTAVFAIANPGES